MHTYTLTHTPYWWLQQDAFVDCSSETFNGILFPVRHWTLKLGVEQRKIVLSICTNVQHNKQYDGTVTKQQHLPLQPSGPHRALKSSPQSQWNSYADMTAFSMVENTGFNNMLKVLDPRYFITSLAHLASTHLITLQVTTDCCQGNATHHQGGFYWAPLNPGHRVVMLEPLYCSLSIMIDR